jgi:hypothetical protein
MRALSSRHGVSSGRRACVAILHEIVLAFAIRSVCHGRTAPPRSDFASSGTMRPKSMPMMRPKPRQLSQAPSGELNENRLGVGSR